MLCHSKAPRLLLTRVEALSRLSYASTASAMSTTRLSPSVQTLRVLAGQWARHSEAMAAGCRQMLRAGQTRRSALLGLLADVDFAWLPYARTMRSRPPVYHAWSLG